MLLGVGNRLTSDIHTHFLYSGNLSMGRVTKLRVGVLLVELISHFCPTSRCIVKVSNGKGPIPNAHIVYIDGAFDLFHHVKTLKYQTARNHICKSASIAHK